MLDFPVYYDEHELGDHFRLTILVRIPFDVNHCEGRQHDEGVVLRAGIEMIQGLLASRLS